MTTPAITMTPKILEGIKVLDLTNVLSGPFATLHLALLGAEVVKVENPKDGDLARKLPVAHLAEASALPGIASWSEGACGRGSRSEWEEWRKNARLEELVAQFGGQGSR